MSREKRCKDCKSYGMNRAYMIKWCKFNFKWIDYLTVKSHNCQDYSRKWWKVWRPK